jgi:hypothetical protein
MLSEVTVSMQCEEVKRRPVKLCSPRGGGDCAL